MRASHSDAAQQPVTMSLTGEGLLPRLTAAEMAPWDVVWTTHRLAIPEVRLCVAVLTQALHDLGVCFASSASAVDPRLWESARVWFDHVNTEPIGLDFVVANVPPLDADGIRRALKSAHCPVCNVPGIWDRPCPCRIVRVIPRPLTPALRVRGLTNGERKRP